MSAIEIAEKYGTAALVRLFGALAIFLLLRGVRWLLELPVRVLSVAEERIDRYIAAGATLAATTGHAKGEPDAPEG
jgi:hypothetical protein